MTTKTVSEWIESLKDNDLSARITAAVALGDTGEEAKAAVPALIEALKDQESEVRAMTALALGKFGEEAKAAVPALIEALKDEADYYRSWRGYPHKVSGAASYALSQIDPEAAGRGDVPVEQTRLRP